MTVRQPVSLAIAFIAVLSLVTARAVEAQVCHGAPPGGGVAFEPGKIHHGSTTGASVAVTPGGIALGLSARTTSAGEQNEGYGAALRFALVFGDKLQICPGIGLSVDRNKWTNSSGSHELTSYKAIARAGVGVGYDFAVYKGFSVAPFVIVEYTYHGTYFDLKIDDYNPTNTGNTGSQAEAEYGAIVHYSHFYAGRAMSHRFAAGRPFAARWILGFAF